MPATVVVGAQWGDEGKGKIVDLLAQRSDVVCRYQGGPNAGHTIVVGEETFKIRATPSGVISGKISVIGAGCVVDPEVLIARARRARVPRNRHLGGGALRQRAPDHAVAHRDRPGLGATARQAPDRHHAPRHRPVLRRQGLADRDQRPGHPRPEDPPAEDRGRARREERLARARLRGRRVRPGRGRDPVRGLCEAAAPDRRRHLAARRRGADAQARTCSSRARRRRCSTSTTAPIRSSPRRTRSLPAPRPASGSGRRGSTASSASRRPTSRVSARGRSRPRSKAPTRSACGDLGGEFGTVTGRVRRCGWLDLVALRYAVRVNGITSLALTKLDVLGDFAELPVCVRYRLRDGSETPHFPAAPERLPPREAGVAEVCRAGLSRSTPRRSRDELPEAARRYVEFVERELECRSSSSASVPRASTFSRRTTRPAGRSREGGCARPAQLPGF